ncbi:MAG: hypothetical protein ACXWVP_11900 [Burkholderiales bacterium]
MTNVLIEVQFYRKLRDAFNLFCRSAGDALAAHIDQYEIKFSPGTGLSRSLLVLGHECEVRFSVTRQGGRDSLVGRLMFERLLPGGGREFFFEITFDHLLYVINQPIETRRSLKIEDPDFIRSFMAVALLDRMLASLSSEGAETPPPT